MSIEVNKKTPWVEKYRPLKLEDIVLSDTNKQILDNILKKNFFPNLLLYGPPGTGKTTTIINLIKNYQELNNEKNKGLMIHLNASDERGIDIIRNQINQFVNSKSLFVNGLKFVILDEVDYMTKNAQQALKYLLQGYTNIRFCLICNYISKIDTSLQNEFVRLGFNELPYKNIISYLNKININESLNIPKTILSSIQKIFKSDMRSMINFIQSNKNNLSKIKILDNSILEKLLQKFIDNSNTKTIEKYIDIIISNYNIEINNLLKVFFYYLIRFEKKYTTTELCSFIEYLLHNNNNNSNKLYIKKYFITRFKEIINKIHYS